MIVIEVTERIQGEGEIRSIGKRITTCILIINGFKE
jgi:hypothetical protein